MNLPEYLLLELKQNGPSTAIALALKAKVEGIIHPGSERIAYNMTYATLIEHHKHGRVTRARSAHGRPRFTWTLARRIS